MVEISGSNFTIKEIELVIFDKDGTMVDLYHYWGAMIEHRAALICKNLGLNNADQQELISRMGVDKKNERLKPEGPVGLKKREIVMQAAVDYLNQKGIKKARDLCFDIFNQVDLMTANDISPVVRPLEGLFELVDTLKNKGCKIAIATTDKTERADLAMRALKLDKSIDFVVGADMVTKTKPDPESIEAILNKLKIENESAVMIGDAFTDVQMGINARLKASIGVCSGLTESGELRRITPYVIENISKIKVN